jgi:lipoate-protein ligase A
MSHALFVVDSGRGAAAWNMALDEALLMTAANRGAALLRFYGWIEPAASFGYSQRFSDVEAQTLLRPLVRRPTGGGLVPHDRDWTYSLVIPPGQPWYALSAIESYRAIHQWLRESWTRLRVDTELAPSRRRELPGQCFAGHEQFDLLQGGRKIAGAAQRRNRQGLLIQGSLQPPVAMDRKAWHEAMYQTAPRRFFAEIAHAPSCGPAEETAESLMKAKYGRPEYHQGR